MDVPDVSHELTGFLTEKVILGLIMITYYSAWMMFLQWFGSDKVLLSTLEIIEFEI